MIGLKIVIVMLGLMLVSTGLFGLMLLWSEWVWKAIRPDSLPSSASSRSSPDAGSLSWQRDGDA